MIKTAPEHADHANCVDRPAAGPHDIRAKHLQLLRSLKLCGVSIGADRDLAKNGFLQQLQAPVLNMRGVTSVPLRRRSTNMRQLGAQAAELFPSRAPNNLA